MNAIQKTICAGLVLASMAGGASLRADGVPRDKTAQRESALQINQANELLRGGNVDGAIGAYQQARDLAPDSADLSYNLAVAQYRKGDVAAAEPLFQAAATSENDTLAARSRYNLGNCNYTAGLQLAERDRPAAIEQLESAITSYRSALAVDAADADARTNIELAARLIDKLREEQKQQEQQQNQQQQQQDQQQQSSDEQQQNGKQGQQDKQQQENKDQKQDQQKDEQQKNEQQQQSQSSPSDKGQDEQSKQDQQSKPDEQQQKQDEKSKAEQSKEEQAKQEQSQSQQQSDQDAGKENQQQQSQSKPNPQQQKANQSPQQKEPSPADESPEKQGKAAPKGELNAAGKEEAKDAKQQEQEVAAFDPSKDGEMTKQEAEKMLQAIRDRDMLRRLRREATERNQYEPVDRDW